MAFCYKCGAELSEGAAFCASCGSSQQGAQQNTQQQNHVSAQAQQQPVQTAAQTQYQQSAGQQQSEPKTDYAQMIKDVWSKIVAWFKKELNTPDYTSMLDPRDVRDNKVFTIFAYLGLFVLIPMFAAPKNSKYSRYHANQGLVLLLCNVAYSILSWLLNLIKLPVYRYGFYAGKATPVFISVILWIIWLPILALTIYGIVNAARGKCRDLPFIGKFKLLKVK